MPLLWLRLLNGGTGKGGIRQEEGSRLIRLEAEHGSSASPPERVQLAQFQWTLRIEFVHIGNKKVPVKVTLGFIEYNRTCAFNSNHL